MSQERWAAGVKEMRDIFGRLEAEGYSKESQQVCVAPELAVIAE